MRNKRNKKLLASGICIILGLMLMRFAHVLIYYNISVVLIIAGAVLFLGGVIFFAKTLFRHGKR